MIGYTVFIVALAIATATISYDSFAAVRGWPVGSILRSGTAFPKIVSGVAVIWTLGKSVILFHWWTPTLLLPAGFLLAFSLVMLLRKHVQSLCIFGSLPAYILVVLYKSEEYPLGSLHFLF